ncbi:Ubiquitin carboxyl-terminal hydrolase 32 [Formica fusca]
MDNKVDVSEVEDISMIGTSGIFHLPDVPEISEVLESTGLSPLTSSLDQALTLQEDKTLSSEVNMGIEDTWTEANSSTSDYAIPLPPPPGLNDFSDVGADPIDSGTGIEHGPFLPPGTPALNNLFAEAGDSHDDSPMEVVLPAGVCGLRNLGNTCFMAAGLQCLTATPPVLRHFLDLQQRGEKLPPPGSLMAHFSVLLGKMWSGRYSVLRPTEFKQTLGAYHSQFKDYRQHDCQEFLALLLDSLHEQMNTAKCAKNCQVPLSTTTANSFNSIENSNGKTLSPVTATANPNSEILEMYECLSPECPNSPNVTMAGSPRDFDSSMGELDSITNSPRDSPLHGEEDEETLDSDEIIEGRSSTFIHNKVNEEGTNEATPTRSLRLDTLIELSKTVPQYGGLYDIHKEAKTSNANFLVTQQECNNEIHYDSQKFPKDNVRRMPLDNSNLVENHDFDNKSVSIKRIKEVNVQKVNGSLDHASNSSDIEYDSGLEKCNVKRMRLDDQEKNHKHDSLGNENIQCSRIPQNYGTGAIAAQEEIEADKHWVKHLRSNKSIIVDTFQGQFKSTVVCSVCNHVSVTYEPFMYLSVPLPHAMERQLNVTYVPANGDQPMRCVVSLNKQSRIGKLKEELLKTLGKENISVTNIALAEVLENHIAKILDDNTLLRHINDTNRSIYAFELTEPPDAYTSVSDGGGDRPMEMDSSQKCTITGEEVPCMICLEELDGDLKRHSGNSCNFIICDPCIENYFKNQTEPQTCPMCSTYVTASSFTKIDQTGRPRPIVRILNVPLVLRHDTTNETTNNRKGTKLFGYPHLIRLPSRVNARDLYDIVKRNVPHEGRYTIHFVDGQGHHCSRCMYTAHCTGCSVPETGMVALQNGDTLAVRYTEYVPKILHPIDHVSVSKQRPHHPLSLYDCLQAFSQSETLDEHNPWFCPKCGCNQCATKTLTVHRYPKFLIVYLKRFVFYECASMKLDDKVTFPLVGLSVGRHLYDLYACVCHFGGVSAGHYTAYAKNPRTDVWYYYNDEITSKQKPQDEDFSNAYILFYSRQGTNLKPCNI